MAKLIEAITAHEEMSMLSTHMSEALNSWVDGLEVSKLFRTCVSCQHFQNNPPFCKKFNLVPPGTIIIHGCDEGYLNIEEPPF